MAVLSTSYEVESSVKTTLKNTISPSATTGIQINYALTVTSGVLNLDGGTASEEYMSFGGATVSSGITTLSDVVRGLNLTGDTFTGDSSRTYQHTGGVSTVELTNYHSLYNLKANKDRANTFTASQTISGTNKWFFNDSDTWIYDNGTDLKFRSSVQSEVSLSTLAAAAGTDEKSKVSVTDTTSGYLASKITGGDGITLTTVNGGGNESLDIDVDLAASSGLEVDGSGKLKVKLDGSTGLVLGAGGLSISSSSLTGVSATDVTSSLTLGESGTATAPMSINGNGRTYNAQSDVLNDATTFVGILKESGAAGESKSHVLAGIPARITALSVNNGRLWLGESNTTQNTSVAVTGNTWKAQTFVPQTGQTNVSRVVLNLTETGTAAGDYLCKIFATSGGLPTGAALGTSTVAASSLVDGNNNFDFSSPVTVTPGTTYAIVLNHSTSDGANNFAWNYNNSSVYANGNGATSVDAGSTWTAEATNDYVFSVYFRSVSGEAVFLQDSEGTLGLTPGTTRRKIGTALSPTQILLCPEGGSVNGAVSTNINFNSSGTVTTDITVGARPKSIFFIASVGGTSLTTPAAASTFVMLAQGTLSDTGYLLSNAFYRVGSGTASVGTPQMALFQGSIFSANSHDDTFANDEISLTLNLAILNSDTIRLTRTVARGASAPSPGSLTLTLYFNAYF